MDNRFESKGKDQNIGQGDRAIGKQTNIFLHPLKLRTLMLVTVLLAGIGGGTYYLFAPAGKSVSSTGDNSPAIVGERVEVNYNSSGVAPEVFTKYVKELGATEQVLNSFFTTLLEQEVPRELWDNKLREIAATHKELLARLSTVQSQDSEIKLLKKAARQAVETGDYAKAENLLNQAEAHDLNAIEKLEKATKERRISAAASSADNGTLLATKLRFPEAAEYWRKAANLLPKDNKKERAEYLLKAGSVLHFSNYYSDALPLYEQSLFIYQEIRDWQGQGIALNNIGLLHQDKKQYDNALRYLKKSLHVWKNLGNKSGEYCALNNIGLLYKIRGDDDKALEYIEHSLNIQQKDRWPSHINIICRVSSK
ncbi:MAG: tetratricopeptide repeat protein [Candidatus Electrothrix sp. AR5]|nr:tetratricopeptide repeat protein [Candidatus Electrothrix sp. AR5]